MVLCHLYMKYESKLSEFEAGLWVESALIRINFGSRILTGPAIEMKSGIRIRN
jgi:hypothetical protein